MKEEPSAVPLFQPASGVVKDGLALQRQGPIDRRNGSTRPESDTDLSLNLLVQSETAASELFYFPISGRKDKQVGGT